MTDYKNLFQHEPQMTIIIFEKKNAAVTGNICSKKNLRT